MPNVPALAGTETGKARTPNGAGYDGQQSILFGPGGVIGSVPREEIEHLVVVTRAVQTCHELSGEGLAGKCDLLRRVGTGDQDAVRRLGLILSPQEAAEAVGVLRADLALLALEDDPELAEPGREALHGELHELPFHVAESLKWLAWHEAWLASLSRASSGSRPLLVDENAAKTGLPSAERLRSAIRARLAEQARTGWTRACEQHPALGSQLATAIAAASGALARHTAARGVFPRQLSVARTEWNNFTDAFRTAEGEAALAEELLEQVKWLLWNAAWHATNLVAMHQGEGDADEEEEEEAGEDGEDDMEDMEDSELFGDEDYPGFERDPLENLSKVLHHTGRLFRSDQYGFSGEPWRGLCLPTGTKESAVQTAAMAGFNALRVHVPLSRGSSNDALCSIMPILRACEKSGLCVVLDFLSFSLRGSQGQESLCRCLYEVASTSSEPGGPPIHGVALPRLTSMQAAQPLVEALRSGGLRPEQCAIVLQLEDDPLHEDVRIPAFLRKAFLQGEQGLLLSDGHIVFEVYRRPPESADSPMALLDAASSTGAEGILPMSCARWGLAVPAFLTTQCNNLGERWREELASRFEAGSGEFSHGWFAMLDDTTRSGVRMHVGSLQMCLSRRWRWPDPAADRVLFTHGLPHLASFVYLHGFTCDGIGYLPCHDYFRKEITVPALDDDEEPERVYMPFPGLKVILPSAPVRSVTCYGGQKFRSWYDYRTDYKGEKEDEFSMDTLQEVVRRVHNCLDAEASLLGGPQRVLLGGASQGAAVALHSALTYPGHLGGVVATQGHLLSSSPVPPEWAHRGTPVRVYSGLADSTMPWDTWVSDTYERLRQTGCDIQFTTEEDVDHGDDEAEGRWIRSFLLEMWELMGLANPLETS